MRDTPVACLGRSPDHGGRRDPRVSRPGRELPVTTDSRPRTRCLRPRLAAHTTVALQNGRRLARRAPGGRVSATVDAAGHPSHSWSGDRCGLRECDRLHARGWRFLRCDPPQTERRTAVVVGDVCGKGLKAATRMAAVRHTLRAYAVLDPDPGRVADAGQREPRVRRRADGVRDGGVGGGRPESRGVSSTCWRATRARWSPPQAMSSSWSGAHDLPLGVGNGAAVSYEADPGAG